MKPIEDEIFPESMPKRDRRKLIAAFITDYYVELQSDDDNVYLDMQIRPANIKFALMKIAAIEGIVWEKKPQLEMVFGSNIDLDSLNCYISDYIFPNTDLNELFNEKVGAKIGTMIFVPCVSSKRILKSPDEP